MVRIIKLCSILPCQQRPPAQTRFKLAQVNQYGRLYFGQKDVSAANVTIDLIAPPVKWLLKMTNPANPNGILNTDPAEVEDVLLVFGYEWEGP